jgi:hypothetical protein
MPGAWITAVARQVLDVQTFELIVSPAVADLQFESATSRRMDRVRGYLAVLVACLGAFGHDLLIDLKLLHDDAPTLIRVVLMQVAYYSSMLTILFAGMSAREAVGALFTESTQIWIALAIIVALSALPTLVCFWPARRTLAETVRPAAD